MTQPLDLRRSGITILEVVNLYVRLAVEDAIRQKRSTVISFDGQDLLRVSPHESGALEVQFLPLGAQLQQRVYMTCFQSAGQA